MINSEISVGLSRGHLGPPRWQPAQIAATAHEGGFRDLALVEAVVVAFAECDGFVNSHNDNLASLGDVRVGEKVRNGETSELYEVIGHTPAWVTIRDSAGKPQQFPPEALVVTSRDVGLWEINIPAEQIGTPHETHLYDPVENAKAAFGIQSKFGWGRWASVSSGIAFDDTYLVRGWLGAANFLASGVFALRAQVTDPKRLTHHTVEQPIVTIPMLRTIYPKVNLG